MDATAEPREHDFEYQTCYCRRCGASMSAKFDGSRESCADGDNVFGISHLIAERRLKAMAGAFSRSSPFWV